MIRAGFPCVFDRCTGHATNRNSNRISPYTGSTILLRDHQIPALGRAIGSEFKYDVDDPRFVNFVLGTQEELDTRSTEISKTLQLKRHSKYWIGLLRHNDPDIRKLAGDHVEAILPVEVRTLEPDSDAPNKEIELAIKELDSPKFRVRKAARNRLSQFGSSALKPPQEVVKSGSPEQRASAIKIVKRLLLLDSNLAADVECGRLLNWLEDNEAKLSWNDATGKYALVN